MAEITIREILNLVPRGQIRVPAFQRGFVWDSDQVAFLMDSIYKGYPFGSLLLWRTREQLRFEKQLGPFLLPNHDPDYPIDYVLDGQQRLTSIFGVFQTEIARTGFSTWFDIYFDLGANENAQESQFVALADADVDPRRHFPLKTLFETIPYRRMTENLGEADVIRVDSMQERFKEVRIPYQPLITENRAKVAIVFERINRTGVPLDTLQLLTAWTWSEEFDLQREFDELREELDPFGFGGVGEDANLLLRCCAAVLAGDAAPDTLVGLRGEDVRARFAEIVNGIKGAIDFLKTNLGVQTIENLPFSTLLVPLCVFFAVPGEEFVRVTDAQRRRLIRWFWRACLSRRFASGVLRNLKDDIEAMQALKEGRANALGDFTHAVDSDFFLQNDFRINSVNTKTFVLMLAQLAPLSFASGQPVVLADVLRAYNRTEFHHIYPKAFLTAQGVPAGAHIPLANFCFLSKADNIHLGGMAPSVYREKMPGDIDNILEHAICPPSIFEDNYHRFLADRARALEAYATDLTS